ncbi:hypothetical protein CTI14_64465, partial [Methylobacterium radiotolerans]
MRGQDSWKMNPVSACGVRRSEEETGLPEHSVQIWRVRSKLHIGQFLQPALEGPALFAGEGPGLLEDESG